MEGNRIMLRKLQATKSNYSVKDWKKDDNERRKLQKMIQGNGDRFCQNPYFLHSVCTAEDSYYITLRKLLTLEAENKQKRKGSAKFLNARAYSSGRPNTGYSQPGRPFSAPGVGGRRKKRNLIQNYQTT